MKSLICIAIAAVFGASQPAAAEDFPSHPVTIVVGFPLGGGLDFLIRTAQPKMEEALGQKLTIENKPGNLGNIANAVVAKSDPDGYTLLMTASNIGVFPFLNPDLAYDPVKAFTAVGEVAEMVNLCVVKPDSKIQSFGDLVKEAKANPGQIKFASEGTGAPSHLIVDLLGKLNDVKLTRVPYDHATLALAAIMDGSVTFSCNGIAGVLAPVKEGKLRPIAITSAHRSVHVPDVPTVKELGFGDVDESVVFMLVAPALTPKPIVDRLSSALKTAVADPSVQAAYIKRGFDLGHIPAADVGLLIQKQHDLWGPFLNTQANKN